MPVVETSMRVPGGQVVHRAWCTRAGSEEWVVAELENRSTAPVAVALAVRPSNPEGLAVVERIALHDRVVVVDGRAALVLPRAPSRVAVSTLYEGDSAGTLLADGGDSAWPGDVRCPAGLAQAAFVFPLAHTASIRVAMPLVPAARSRRASVARRRAGRVGLVDLAALPAAERVANGWRSHAQPPGSMRLELPDARLAEAVAANRVALLVLHDGDEITPGPATYHRFWFRDAAYLLGALDRYGHHGPVREVLASYPARQRVDGTFLSQRHEWDGAGSALWAMADHWRLTRDRASVEHVVGSVAKGAHWLARKRRRGPGGMLPAGVSAEHLGPFDTYYWDDLWGIAGQLAAAEVLDGAGQPAAAARCRELAAAFRVDLDASLARSAERLGSPVIPAGPRRRVDGGIIGSLAACEPLRLLAPDDPRMVATLDVVRERFCGLGGVPAYFQGISHTGFGTYLTLQVAAVELAAGDRRALERFEWIVDHATPTWTWPEALHPAGTGGCMGDGHHGWAAAAFLTFVRDLLVREVGSPADPDRAALALASMWPDGWLGQSLAVHDAPTWWGHLSYAVRWHGARPALLWELVPHDGLPGPVRLTAPGLDPSWTTTEPRGEALLAPVEPSGGLPKVVAPLPDGGVAVDVAAEGGSFA